MSTGNQDDRWLWFIDDAPLQALLRAEAGLPGMQLRAASSPAVVRAVALNMEGHPAEAAAILEAAAAAGDHHPDVFVLLGQILYEAGRLEEAAAAYARLIRAVIAISPLMLILYAGLLGIAGWMLVHTPTGFIPKMDRGIITVSLQLPPGASLQRTDEVVRRPTPSAPNR